MDHKLHIKLYIKTAKGFTGELNVFGNTGKEMATDIAGLFEALHLEPDQGLVAPAVDVPARTPEGDHEAEIATKTAAFLAECEVHKTRWYDNESKRPGAGTYKSHKVEQGVFCQYSKIAKAAWDDLMQQLSWGETEAKAFLTEHFGGKPFSSLSERDQAMAIARLRVGR